MMKTNLEHKTCPNLLERNFIQDEPQKVLSTDITYLDYGTKGRRAYWSCVKDGSTNELVANYLSSTLKMTIIYETLDILKETFDGNIHPEALLHSDQGVHYTHLEFQKRVERLGITQSM